MRLTIKHDTLHSFLVGKYRNEILKLCLRGRAEGSFLRIITDCDSGSLPEGSVLALVAVAKGQAVGLCLYWKLNQPLPTGNRIDSYCCGFYVNPKFRRLGIGSKLMTVAKKEFGQFAVFPWNKQAKAFFLANKPETVSEPIMYM